MAIAAIVRAPRALIVVGFVAIIATMPVRRRARRLSRRRRVALVARPDRMLRPDYRFIAKGRCSISCSRSISCAATRRPGAFSAFRSPVIMY